MMETSSHSSLMGIYLLSPLYVGNERNRFIKSSKLDKVLEQTQKDPLFSVLPSKVLHKWVTTGIPPLSFKEQLNFHLDQQGSSLIDQQEPVQNEYPPALTRLDLQTGDTSLSFPPYVIDRSQLGELIVLLYPIMDVDGHLIYILSTSLLQRFLSMLKDSFPALSSYSPLPLHGNKVLIADEQHFDAYLDPQRKHLYLGDIQTRYEVDPQLSEVAMVISKLLPGFVFQSDSEAADSPVPPFAPTSFSSLNSSLFLGSSPLSQHLALVSDNLYKLLVATTLLLLSRYEKRKGKWNSADKQGNPLFHEFLPQGTLLYASLSS